MEEKKRKMSETERVIAIENGRVVRDESKGEYGYDD